MNTVAAQPLVLRPQRNQDLTTFLAALWPDLGGHHLLLWRLPSKRSEWVQEVTSNTIARIEQWAESEDVYAGCGLRNTNLGPTRRGERADVVAIPGLWIDADYSGNSGDHKKPNLPPTEADARKLLEEMGLPPSAIVHSGHGLQAWWLFREPWVFEDDADRDKAERLTKAWCDTFRAKAQARGWDADQVGDLPRVMRLPGTWNRKGAPVQTRLLSLTEARYNPDDFEAYLSAAPLLKRTIPSQPWTFELHADAEPPAEKFLLLCEIDLKFRMSWAHQRTDLQDQSASSYDLSLASRALAAGWNVQEIVNLLIAHRRKHGADLKLDHSWANGTKNYYSVTLDAAASGKSQPEKDLREHLAPSVSLPVSAESVKDSGILTHSYPCTDSGNAEHFASKYGDIVRYDHRRGRWLLWRAHRWCPDLDEEIRRLSKLSSRDRFKSAAACEDLKERERLAKWAIQSESRSKLDALLALAKAEMPIADAGDDWDRDPFLLGVPNGVVDLRTGVLRPGRQTDRITMSTGVSFDPTAACARWERFVLEVFGDDELAGFVRRAIGYSLTGQTEEQCLFLCYGTGANGKSTLVGTLASLFGDYGWNMPFSTIEQHQRASIPNDMAALVGRRFVVASETNDGTRLNEARVKALTGCDPITARFLHAEFFTFRPVAKMWLSVNHKPIVQDDSHGFWRRIRLIPFQQTFSVNQTLGKELHAEREGILAWAVRGCLEWQQQGLKPPRCVSEATREYERESDPLGEFIAEFCVVEATSRVGAADLYTHYLTWTRRHEMLDREKLTSTMFGKKMSERFMRENSRSGRVYLGIERRGL